MARNHASLGKSAVAERVERHAGLEIVARSGCEAGGFGGVCAIREQAIVQLLGNVVMAWSGGRRRWRLIARRGNQVDVSPRSLALLIAL